MDPLAFYGRASPITYPGRMAYLYDLLPADIPTPRRVASGIVVHYRAADLAEKGIVEERDDAVSLAPDPTSLCR